MTPRELIPAAANVDPVEVAAFAAHLALVDLLAQIRQAHTPARALEIHDLLKEIVLTAERLQGQALEHADKLMESI